MGRIVTPEERAAQAYNKIMDRFTSGRQAREILADHIKAAEREAAARVDAKWVEALRTLDKTQTPVPPDDTGHATWQFNVVNRATKLGEALALEEMADWYNQPANSGLLVSAMDVIARLRARAEEIRRDD